VVLCFFSSAEVDIDSNTADFDEGSESSEHVGGKTVSDNRVNDDQKVSVMNQDSIDNQANDIDVDAVDASLNGCFTSEDSPTKTRRLPQLTTRKKRHKCEHCSRVCSSLAVLQAHCSISHGNKDFLMPAKADKVQRRLSQRPSYMRHPNCWICGRVCSSLAVFKEHFRLKHSTEDQSILGDELLLRSKVFIHQENSLESEKKYAQGSILAKLDKFQLRLSRRWSNMKHPSCWICGRICSSLAVFKEHFRLKHFMEDQSILSNELLLRSKVFIHQADSLRSKNKRARNSIQCDLCSKVCRSLWEFDKHILTHGTRGMERQDISVETGGDKQWYVCDVCGKACSRPSALASHRRFHVRNNIHSCVQCGVTFKERRYLVRHQRRHSGIRPFVCEHCGQSFMRQVSLRDHKSRQHHDKVSTEADRPYFHCKRCGDQFCQISQLRRHIVETHRPARPKERCLCTLCGKSFSCKFTLKMHVRLHTGERPHKCSQCERSFPTRAALRQHMLKHTNNYLHVCSTCGKRFSFPSTLAKHERVHSAVKSFCCERCGKLFRHNHYLKQHVALAHAKDKLLQCNKCDASYSRQIELRRHYLHVHPTAEFVTQP